MTEARRMRAAGNGRVSEWIAKVRADHRLLGRITRHWFRHLLAPGCAV